ncbi:peptidylprolyl isomerase [Novosphingobium sp. ERW19]|uniref:peptidylprolyl isomerase n=1 Tax=Novosphingobium sp. ERW19 TaxID=2726186 RepID=UPI0014579025|nr:peptidylprolyl isomerase [Novosphingobium sp. ERW19]NLR39143.1 peptidylprolyl isomerase [Novosphingobium sp. ERW19]
MSLLLALAAAAASPAAPKPAIALSPGEVVAASPAADWQAISPDDLLVMDLAPDAKGKPRRVVIQLMPEPFSQGWVGNVRKLAAAHWWDGLTVYRVQDNWVSQWGDADGEDKAKAKPLPADIEQVPQERYVVRPEGPERSTTHEELDSWLATIEGTHAAWHALARKGAKVKDSDPYADETFFYRGWPVAASQAGPSAWPVHCYGSIGVARDMPPDTGTGAELYAVIGHAPRQLDRNLAVVGRVIEGMQFLSSLPRGPAPMGVYADPAERTPILSVHPASEVVDMPVYEFLSTESASFRSYAEASANHREAFYVQPAGGVDICNLKVPVRRRK